MRLCNYLARWKPGTDGSVLAPDLAERFTVSPDGVGIWPVWLRSVDRR